MIQKLMFSFFFFQTSEGFFFSRRTKEDLGFPAQSHRDLKCLSNKRAIRWGLHSGCRHMYGCGHTHVHTFVSSSSTYLQLGCIHTHIHSYIHYTHSGPTGQLGSHADMVMRRERQSLSQILHPPPPPYSAPPSRPFSPHNPIQKHPSQAVCR